MSTTYEHKGVIPGLEFGQPVRISRLDGKAFAPARGVETKQSGAYEDALDQLLAEARARLAADAGGDGDHNGGAGDDGEEDAVIHNPELPQAGPDEQIVVEAPLESLSEETRKWAVLAQMVAEEHLPPPGPPKNVKVRFRAPYLRSTAEAYQSITGRAAVPFLTGKGWAGHFDPNTDEIWLDIGGVNGGELPRCFLHELTHAWRERTPQARTMTSEAKEEEAWEWAERLLPKVFELRNETEGAA